MRKPKKGFTLIELLVVIAIIAILAAILLPVFLAAKDRGKRATCLSNFRQMGIAQMLYLDDNRSGFPIVNEEQTQELVKGYGWYFWVIAPYLKSPRMTVCPANLCRPAVNCSWYAAVTPGVHWGWWGLWGAYRPSQPGWGVSAPARMSEVKIPTKVVSFMESDCKYGSYNCGPYVYYGNPPHWWKPMHGYGAHFVFADGHASWYDCRSITAMPDWPEMGISWRKNYPDPMYPAPN